MEWEAFDPSWLVTWLRARRPDLNELATALESCTQALPEDESRAYLRFVDPSDTTAWQWERNVLLEDTPRGLVLLVVLLGGAIGGSELLDEAPS